MTNQNNPLYKAALSAVSSHFKVSKTQLTENLKPGRGEAKQNVIMARGAYIFLLKHYGIKVVNAAESIDLDKNNAYTYCKKYEAKTSASNQAVLMTKMGQELKS